MSLECIERDIEDLLIPAPVSGVVVTVTVGYCYILSKPIYIIFFQNQFTSSGSILFYAGCVLARVCLSRACARVSVLDGCEYCGARVGTVTQTHKHTD